jgi:hypothetical protein
VTEFVGIEKLAAARLADVHLDTFVLHGRE